MRVAVAVQHSWAENTDGAQPGRGQLQLLVCRCELRVCGSRDNNRSPSGCQGSYLVWQQPKEGSKGSLQHMGGEGKESAV